MIKPKLSMKSVSANFFDSKKVTDAIGKVQAKIFSEFGKRVRATARASLVYDAKPSAPGSPPHAHKTLTILRRSRRTGKVIVSKKTGKARIRNVSFLRNYLFYKYDTTTKSVVIGPERLSATVDPNSLQALEHGGSSTILDHGHRKSVTIKARPFMWPAAQANLDSLPPMWRDSVR